MSEADVYFLSEFDSALSNQGFLPNYVPPTTELEQAIKKEINSDRVYSAIESHYPEKSLSELLEKYNIESPRSFVATEMSYMYDYPKPSREPYFLSGDMPPNFDPYIDQLNQTLDYLDNLYKTGNGGVPLQNQGGEILRRSLQAVADDHETPSIWIGFSPIDGKSGLFCDETVTWPSYGDISYDCLTDKERDRANDHLNKFHSNDQRIQSGMSKPPIYHKLRNMFDRLTRYGINAAPFFERWIRSHIFKPLLAKYAKLKYLNSSKTKQIISDCEYIFYPIQYYRESRILVRAPSYYDQVWLIEYMSRALPSNHELCVKDHPLQIGAQSKNSIDSIVNYSHALDPNYSTHDILRNASAVVVLNSTVGYEAIMHGKPVIALGDEFYTGHGYTIDLESIDQLKNTMHNGISSDGLSHRDKIEFCHGLIEGSYQGVWGDTSEENLRELAKSISEFIHTHVEDL